MPVTESVAPTAEATRPAENARSETSYPAPSPTAARGFRYLRIVIVVVVLLGSLLQAYHIRLTSVRLYGYIIHEFDPWFNYRAAEYMSTHGWTAFFRWFDYMSWYPLGRPVGSTTYPGLQFTAVAIHRSLAALGMPLTLNEVCVLMPAWFGALATLLVALMAYEMTGSPFCMAATAYIYKALPAHLMRSMAGEFDNECIALAAMLLVFYLWMRSLRTPSSWPIGALAGVAYGYMVAAWGGYTFVLNMVALHAGVAALVDWGRNTYSNSLLRSYALFYVVGTSLSTLVPPVGMAPFKSLELLGALVVLLFLGSLQLCEVQRKRAEVAVHSAQNLKIRLRVFGAMGGAMVLLIAVLMPMGYFGPLSARVRALFVQHTRTGNPLIDSVAEHRKTDPKAYTYFLDFTNTFWIGGTLWQLVSMNNSGYEHAKLFIVLYSSASFYFADRMSRLMVLAGPASAAVTAGLFNVIHEWCWMQLTGWAVNAAAEKTSADDAVGKVAAGGGKKKMTTARAVAQDTATAATAPKPASILRIKMAEAVSKLNAQSFFVRMSLALVLLLVTVPLPQMWYYEKRCATAAQSFANPRLMFYSRLQNGQTVLVRDYPDAYEWLRKNTPEDARVLAWWDYGYQITGIGNRTSLADGNTWNHEHIATIGKMLTSPVAEAHSLVRHMADYVLIWAGQGGDLGKSPHMARIGNSVYHDICPDDPACKKFGFHSNDRGKPTPMMKDSLLYNLHEYNRRPDLVLDPSFFQEAYTSKYGLVRIFKVMNVSLESKRWIADAANRVCDPPGSWICPGQYPPAKEIQDMLAHRVDY